MRLETVTRTQRDEGRKALAPFFTAGYPDEAVFLDLIRAAADVGCRVVEIGVPFSDPVADGPLIQKSSHAALAGGMTLRRALALTAKAVAETGVMPVIMSYLNPIMRMGLDGFAAAAADAGVGGVILPDVPVEEAQDARAALSARDLDLVSLMAPTTDADRAREIAGSSSGFLYLVSLTGVTGADLDVESTVPSLVARARAVTDLPAYVGFGVSTAEQARDAVAAADGVIIGSALVKIIDSAGADPAGAVHAYLGGVAGGLT
jgi:tryptophan synthase alpha chain